MSSKTSTQKQFSLILTTGNSTPIPLHILLNLQELGLVRVAASGLARVKRGCVAYQHEGTGEIVLYVQTRGDVAVSANIPSMWYALIRAAFYKVRYEKGKPVYEQLYSYAEQML